MSLRIELSVAGFLAPRLANIASVLGIASLLVVASAEPSYSTNFKLAEYIELEKRLVDELIPGFSSAFPNARFYATGFSAPSGEWKFIRAEGSACEQDRCPTIVRAPGAEWSIVLVARRDVVVSINNIDTEYVECDLRIKNAVASIRFTRNPKTFALVVRD